MTNKIEILHRIALNENCVISVVCPSLEGLRALWNDTLSIFILSAKRRNKIEYVWEYQNGSMVIFHYFNRSDILFVQGLKRDYLYTFDSISGDIYNELIRNTREMVFLELS